VRGPATVVLLVFAALVLTVRAPVRAESVRIPRDSPIVIHGRVQPPGSFDPARLAPSRHGSQSVWVPGRWIWPAPK